MGVDGPDMRDMAPKAFEKPLIPYRAPDPVDKPSGSGDAHGADKIRVFASDG